MPELLSPGVYIQEVPFGPQPIEGVSTSTAGFVGEASFGPTEGPPTLVTSFPDFQRKFGGLVAGKHLGYAMQGFFDNGGRRAYVARVVGTGATQGSVDVPNTGLFVPILGAIAPIGGAQYRIALESVVRLDVGAGTLLVLDRSGVDEPVVLTVDSIDAVAAVVTATASARAGSVRGNVLAPFNLEPGDTLVVDRDALGTATATFNATAAQRDSATAGPFTLADLMTLTVKVDRGVLQTVTFHASEFPDITNATAAQVAAVLEANLVGVAATLAAGKVRISTDRRGTGAYLEVTGGTANGALGFVTAEIQGTGNVVAIDSVTIAEVKTVVEAAVSGVTVSDDLGRARISSDTTGTSSMVTIAATSTADAALGLDNTAHVGGVAPGLSGRSGARYYVQVVGPSGAGSRLTLVARDEGAFASGLSVFVEPYYGSFSSVTAKVADDEYELASVADVVVGDAVELRAASSRHAFAVTAIDGATRRVKFAAGSSTNFAGGRLCVVKWRTRVFLVGALVESLDGLSSDDARFTDAVAGRSTWIRVQTATLDPTSDDGFAAMALASRVPFAGGSDGSALTDSDVVGGTLVPRTGLGSIEGQDGINLIATPGFNSQIVVNALVSQAERLQDRFAVFDSANQADVSDVLMQRNNYNSEYAAMYHPWLRINDPLTNLPIDFPPSGHVLGAYARTDNDRGVFKAPANIVLRSVLGFTRDISGGEQDVLNPAGVNVLRKFDGLGLVIWGSRTITADTLWKYVPVRRLFIFLEQSIVRGTRYAVFEPNSPALWKRITDSVTNFLTTQWRAGALFGDTPAQAFFVKCDDTTTTQDDRDNGRVNIVIGIAPVKPAEFVVFQIGQAPSSVIIAEQS